MLDFTLKRRFHFFPGCMPLLATSVIFIEARLLNFVSKKRLHFFANYMSLLVALIISVKERLICVVTVSGY